VHNAPNVNCLSKRKAVSAHRKRAAQEIAKVFLAKHWCMGCLLGVSFLKVGSRKNENSVI